MEPVDSRLLDGILPPPLPGTGASPFASDAAAPMWSVDPQDLAVPSTAGDRIATGGSASNRSLRAMAPWRIGGAVALSSSFGLIGWQVQRLIDGRLWSNAIMWAAVAAGVAAAVCLLVWTWVATDNGRRLIGPATNRQLPEPRIAVTNWFIPLAFVAISVVVVAALGARVDPAVDDSIAAIPLAVAVISLLLAIPLTYRPLSYLAGMIRQVGGYTVGVARWMWVPVVLGVVGVGSIVALRFGAVDGRSATEAAGWAPLWVVAVVAIAPSVIVILLAWRAGRTVEEALTIAAARRRQGVSSSTPNAPRGPVGGRQVGSARTLLPALDTNRRVDLVPGTDLLRLAIVTLIAGLALLSVVGASVMFMAWTDADAGHLLPADRRHAWDTIDTLHGISRAVSVALLIAVMAWSFIAVLNVRRASGRRANPLIAAAAWPLSAIGIWMLADRFVVDRSIGSVVVGFAAQSLVLAVPFLVLERTAGRIGARRTPFRITYVFAVILLVHVQGLGGLSTIDESMTSTSLGRLSGYLIVGAIVQLLSTMAVTESCSSLTRACRHEAEHHNMLIDQRGGSATFVAPVTSPGR